MKIHLIQIHDNSTDDDHHVFRTMEDAFQKMRTEYERYRKRDERYRERESDIDMPPLEDAVKMHSSTNASVETGPEGDFIEWKELELE